MIDYKHTLSHHKHFLTSSPNYTIEKTQKISNSKTSSPNITACKGSQKYNSYINNQNNVNNLVQQDIEQRQPFLTHCFTVVICRNQERKWLCVNETKKRGLWVPGGVVPPGEDFKSSAVLKTKNKTNIDIEIVGLLRIEHNNYGKQSSRMRVVFFAIPKAGVIQTIKSVSDEQSDGALWLSLEEIRKLSETSLGIRGPEVIDWPNYIENGGIISPLKLLSTEEEKITIIKLINNSKEEEKMIEERKDSIQNNNKNISPRKQHQQEFKKENENNELNLIDALMNDNLTLIKKCLIFGMDCNIPINSKGWRPLHYALKTNNEELVKILLLSDASLETYTLKKRNCLHFAVQSTSKILNQVLIYLSFVDQKIKDKILNFKDKCGDTPLHILLSSRIVSNENVDYAKYENYKIVFQVLINMGARCDIANNKGVSCDMFRFH